MLLNTIYNIYIYIATENKVLNSIVIVIRIRDPYVI